MTATSALLETVTASVAAHEQQRAKFNAEKQLTQQEMNAQLAAWHQSQDELGRYAEAMRQWNRLILWPATPVRVETPAPRDWSALWGRWREAAALAATLLPVFLVDVPADAAWSTRAAVVGCQLLVFLAGISSRGDKRERAARREARATARERRSGRAERQGYKGRG